MPGWLRGKSMQCNAKQGLKTMIYLFPRYPVCGRNSGPPCGMFSFCGLDAGGIGGEGSTCAARSASSVGLLRFDAGMPGRT
jgi:hypothetical protein